MKFLCGGCRTKYQISDEKIRSKILTIRCKKCGAKILVRESLAREAGGTAVAPVAEEERAVVSVGLQGNEQRSVVGGSPKVGGSAALASAFEVAMTAPAGEEDMPTCIAPKPANLDAAGVEWYTAIDGEQSGPFAFAEIVRRVQAKEVVGRHYVWHDGMEGWHRVRDVADLATYLAERKKPPPPPPSTGEHRPEKRSELGAGAEVVDFASKRKEREQRRGAASDPPENAIASDAGIGAIPSSEVSTPSAPYEAATEAKVEVQAPSAREAQLDHVLNEALGIRSEAPTPRPPSLSPAIAVSGTAVSSKPGAAPALDDLLSFDKDDIFANVPRALHSENVQREKTSFFVAAAGVHRQRSRNRIASIVGIGALLALASFVVCWAVGIVEVSLPGIGNPFAPDGPSDEEELADYVDPNDPEQVRRLLEGDDGRRGEGGARRRRIRARSPEISYVQEVADKTDRSGSGTREGDSESVPIAGLDVALPAKDAVPEASLPTSGVENVPVVERATLSQDAIRRVVNDKKKSVSICYQQSLRGNEDLRGKLEFLVTIEPSGLVSRASVETSAFKGSKLARCIATKIKDWRFPPFIGEAQQVQVPFVLEKNSY